MIGRSVGVGLGVAMKMRGRVAKMIGGAVAMIGGVGVGLTVEFATSVSAWETRARHPLYRARATWPADSAA